MTPTDAAAPARPTAGRSPSTRRPAASTRSGSSPRDPEAYDRFYNIFANPMLWFIQHYLWDLSNAPDVRRNEIEAFDYGYQVVNDDLAQAVIEEIDGIEEPVVMVHDYHLYTLPGIVRRARPDVFLHHFVHIPWTQADAWRVLPNRIRDELYHGLLANDIIGFHTQLLQAQLPAVLPRPDRASTSTSSAASSLRGPRGVGAQLPAAHRRALDPRGRRARRAWPSSSTTWCAAAATTSSCAWTAPTSPRTSCAASARSTCSSSSTRISASA